MDRTGNRLFVPAVGDDIFKQTCKGSGKSETEYTFSTPRTLGNREREYLPTDNNSVKNDLRNLYTLEPNHTHYIFFDDGTYNSNDTSGFASKLAREISFGARRRIPLVNILAGGNLHALKSIWKDLRDHVPIVIIDKSGPLANILCKYFKATSNISQSDERVGQNGNSNDHDNDLDRFLNDHYFALANVKQPQLSLIHTSVENSSVLGIHLKDIYKDLLKLYDVIRQKEYKTSGKTCLNFPLRNNIHILNLDSSNTLQNTIYGAMVQAKSNLSKYKSASRITTDDRLHLALHWGLPTIPGDQALSNTIDWNDQKQIDDNQSILLDALKNTYLSTLYSKEKRKHSDPLNLLDKIDQRHTFQKPNYLNAILEILVGDVMIPLYDHQSESEYESRDIECIYRDIYLWCVLTYRLNMAKVILGKMKTRICSALIASKILKSLTKYAPDHESKEQLYSEAKMFETYAIEFVRCSYFYNKQLACELIIRKLSLYGDVTCLQMAIEADNKRFLSEDACQALLTNIWYDKIDPVQERNRLVVNVITMGISQFFISFYEKRSYKIHPEKEGINAVPPTASERRLAVHGINYSDDYTIDKSKFMHFFHFHNQPIVKYVYTCFYSQENRTWKGKILNYFHIYNRISNLCLVLPSFILFYVGLVLRFVLTDISDFSAARVVMAYDLELWFIRTVLFVGVVSSLGPKLAMIRKMTNDLLLFIIIIVIFIFGYGITSRSMTAYGTFDLDGRQFFRNIVYPVYYFVLGKFDDELAQLDITPDVNTTIATQVMLAFHMLIVNILLLNLLIALFSNTINDVQTQAYHIWAYDRCAFIRDFYFQPPLFPPFRFLIWMVEFLRWWWHKCKNDDKNTKCFKMIPEIPYLDNEWSEFERFSTNDYIRYVLDSQIYKAANTITPDISSEISPTGSDEANSFKSDMINLKNELKHSQNDNSEKLSSVESTVSNLGDQVKQISTHIDEIMQQMRSMENQLTSASQANPIRFISSSAGDDRDYNYSTKYNGSITLTLSSNYAQITTSVNNVDTHDMFSNGRRIQQCYKLLTDCNVPVYRARRRKNFLEKIVFFRRWINYHIHLGQSEITLTTNATSTDNSIAFSVIKDISVRSKFKIIHWNSQFCITIVTNDHIYFFKINTRDLRDQLFYSMKWKLNKFKFERNLRSTDNSEILLKEIKNLIDFTTAIPIEDVEVHHFPLEIVCEILQKQEFNSIPFVYENAIEALAPLLEKNYPSPEACDFFTRYCRDSPRSPIVMDMFALSVQKILKHNTNFRTCLRMRTLVQEYLFSLNSQNDGLQAVDNFIKRMHSPTMVCPFLRVPSNLISVCLAEIYSFFKERKRFHFENEDSCREYDTKNESQLICYTHILQTIIYKNVVKNLVEDPRCEVHQTVLGKREGKDGWFETFCFNGNACCNDDGEMFSQMLNKLISCCCRKKSFLLSINKLLPSLMLLALRGRQSSLDTLCAMLDLDAVENHDNKLKLISTLKLTSHGSNMYANTCARQRVLKQIQQKGGPRELTLEPNSIDSDLAGLLSRGPLGNLECLNLAFTHVTSACAKHIINLPALKDLNVRSTRFGDAGLELISEHLNQLEILNLSETPVTDKGLTFLANMKMLRKLNLNSTNVSDLAILTLQLLSNMGSGKSRFTQTWRLFSVKEKRNIIIYVIELMLYKFGLEAFNGSIVTLAINHYDEGALRSGISSNAFERVGLISGLNQAF
ncbi:unnamed protein product [Rotaria socialis]|uniref:Uncharacterized protein n=2 Tax=Rotaria socialis TaxID=392032 RepID=A0A821I728_9BILA|nr:unnamed protein product [Rotaria socialis]